MRPVDQGIVVPCPWFAQRDNALNPGGTCNMTATAMVLSAYGIVGDGNGQLEDQLVRECLRRGLDYHSEHAMRAMIEWKGRQDRFTYRATWDQIRRHLQAGGLVILHTWLTKSGHIVVCRGWDPSKRFWLVNDPAGEWANGGYGAIPDGDSKWYSHRLMDAVCRADSYAEAMDAYRSGRPVTASKTQIWAHLVSR